MKIINEIINENITISKYLDVFSLCNPNTNFAKVSNEEVIFFDIETTGLNVAKTNLYLIGYVYYKNNSWHYCQLFAESLKEEKTLILEFEKVCSSYKYLIHFNGDHFDIPYINAKCESNGVKKYLQNLISIDIYSLVKLYKHHLGLTNCKQKTIENLLNITRKDKYNGGELIFQYFDYLKSNDTQLEENLLLHNAEDCIGMLKLLTITDYIKIVNFIENGNFDIKLLLDKNELKNKYNRDFGFELIPNDTKLVNSLNHLSYLLKEYQIEISHNNLIFMCDLKSDELKHFFKDIQNYYYIPSKDMAMHKTVAKYISQDDRIKAKLSNCYVKTLGTFLPVFGKTTDALLFKTEHNATNNYVLFISNEGELKLTFDELKTVIYSSLKNINSN